MGWRSSRSSCHGLFDEITIITSVIDDSCNCSNYAFFVYPVQKDLVLHNQLPVLIMQQIHTVCLDKRAIWPQFWVIFCRNSKNFRFGKNYLFKQLQGFALFWRLYFRQYAWETVEIPIVTEFFQKRQKNCILAKSAYHLYPQNLKTAGNLFSAACFL